MPRKITRGQRLQKYLEGEYGLSRTDIMAALGISSATYYRRWVEDNYPSEEECERLSETFSDLGVDKWDLIARFEVISSKDEIADKLRDMEEVAKDARKRIREYKEQLDSGPFALAVREGVKGTVTAKRARAIRPDAPPL